MAGTKGPVQAKEKAGEQRERAVTGCNRGWKTKMKDQCRAELKLENKDEGPVQG